MNTKRKLIKEKSPVRDVGTLAVMMLANSLAGAMEKKRRAANSEEALNRKLTIISLIYHAIGILYNE